MLVIGFRFRIGGTAGLAFCYISRNMRCDLVRAVYGIRGPILTDPFKNSIIGMEYTL